MERKGTRVVFCTYDSPGNVSGPNAWLLRLLPELVERSIFPSVLVFSLEPLNSPIADALSEKGLDVHVYRFKSTTRDKVRWILKFASENTINLFVPNHVIAAYYAAGYLKKAGIPTIGVLHSDDAFNRELLRLATHKNGFYCVRGLVCVSDFLRERAEETAPVDVSVNRIPCGVPIPSDRVSEPDETLRLVYVGRLEEEQKRISELTRSFCSVTRSVPGVAAMIIGNGTATPSVRQIISEERAGERVDLVGRVDPEQIQEKIMQGHVIVLLSDYEGLPIALMEGMACGLVPICKKISSGIPELIDHEVNGLLVEDGKESFTLAVEELKTNPDFWTRLSARSRSTIAENFSSTHCANEWADLIEFHAEFRRIKEINIPFLPKIPRLRRVFMREDFRVHQVLARAANRFLRYFS